MTWLGLYFLAGPPIWAIDGETKRVMAINASMIEKFFIIPPPILNSVATAVPS
ncbi:MAG: hypothetical protein PVJ20_13665 [Desulfobacterales bacterium]|jgi:hypothetical protein